jgi:hypothetical protein
MALFGSKPNSSHDDHHGYAEVLDDENKPLTLHHIDEETSQQLEQHEIYALSRSLKRTNLYLKIIIGLLCFAIIAILSMNVPSNVKEMIRTMTCKFDPIIKTPVPYRM